MADRIILREDDHSGGTTATVPLSDEARRLLARSTRLAPVWLWLAVVAVAGSMVGLVLGGPKTLVSLVLPALLLSFYFIAGVPPRKALRDGRMRRYEGWWEERGVWQRNSGWQVEVKLPDYSHVLTFRDKATLQAAGRGGTNENWGPSQGVVEYTVVSRIPLTYRQHQKKS